MKVSGTGGGDRAGEGELLPEEKVSRDLACAIADFLKVMPSRLVTSAPVRLGLWTACAIGSMETLRLSFGKLSSEILGRRSLDLSDADDSGNDRVGASSAPAPFQISSPWDDSLLSNEPFVLLLLHDEGPDSECLRKRAF